MANVINPYDPIWYAQEGLAQLEKSLGMAGRVYRGYDKAPQQVGSTIQIKTPGTFTAQDAPSSAQDLTPTSQQVTLSYWREVKFKLTDKELNTAGEVIIRDHIRPAAVALADDIDQKLVALAKEIPWYTDVALTSAAVSDITAARRVLFDNKVPLDDIHMMIDGALEEKFLALAAFTQFQGAGDQGVNAQMRGSLGTKFGFGIFSNQNVISLTSATVADLAGTVTSNPAAKGATTLGVTALSAAAALKIGDIVIITGHAPRYTLAADVTLGGSGEGNLTLAQPLEAEIAQGTVVTVVLNSGSGLTKAVNLAFHRNAFCLAMAPLTTMPRELGARIETVTDPITGLSLRSRVFYDGNASTIYVALDILYGIKVLNRNMAVRMRAA
jgi:hypothetical protein